MEKTDDAFIDNKYVDYIKLDSDLRNISEHGFTGSFSGCSSLKQVIIPFSVVIMECYAFIDCNSLIK